MGRKHENADELQVMAARESVKRFHGRRVRLARVEEGQGLSVAEHELLLRIGKEGVCDCKNFDGNFNETISVLFDDGIRLPCVPIELELIGTLETTPLECDPIHSANETGAATPTHVQACITSVSFANSITEMPGLVEEGRDTNMEWLLWPEKDDVNGAWSVARWMTAGDILFFYHTKSAAQRIQQLLNAADDPDNLEWADVQDRDHVIARLEEQLTIAEAYGGTIFACAILTGNASMWSDSKLGSRNRRHWKGNIHAEISRVSVFARPVPDYAFNSFLRIRQGAITPLHGSAFTELKTLIGSGNVLPAYVANANADGVSFRDVDETNWIQISCSPRARFIDESQFREYLVDYLLDRIKDPRTPVHQECTCAQDGKHPSYADYCIRVHGQWIVVETKLTVLAEVNLIGQISKYLGIREFSPNWRCKAETVVTGPTAAVCMVIDTSGIYLADKDGFVGCELGKPIWPIREMSDDLLLKIRNRLKAIL
jgi:hypothetical protein